MEKDDVVLIDSILAGDDTAFSHIVNKYQKSVHALIWRKTGDFQVAEEIAQDTFLQAYQKLATLKNRTQFAGWLYVIASNLCSDWHRRKKPTMQSLEATNTGSLDRTSYESYVAEQRDKAATERRREIVKNLLNKLPESERTVVTLFYLGEMTSEAISKFLGVSVNTIKSRLRRARKRLQKEEPMIRETLGTVTLPVDFTENIMEKISTINPSPPSTIKPLIPITALGTAAILVMLLLGVGSHFFSNFQKPYHLDADTLTEIEIFDSAVPIDVEFTPKPKRRIGNIVIANKSNGIDEEQVETIESTLTQVDSLDNKQISSPNWTQRKGPQGGKVLELFLTSKGKILGIAPTGIYQVKEDTDEWMLINNTVPIEEHFNMPIAENNNILYLVSIDEIFVSVDSGITWVSIGPRPIGRALELIITDKAFYLVLKNGVYISTTYGKDWSIFNNGIEETEITTAAAEGNMIFVGTDRGVFRLQSDRWEQLEIGKYREVTTLFVSGNSVYLGTVPTESKVAPIEQKRQLVREMLHGENSKQWELYRSDDLGGTWTKITPRNRSILERLPFGVNVLVTEHSILTLGSNVYRSTDNGITWENLGSNFGSIGRIDKTALAVNKETFYTHGTNGILRSTDGGETWNPFMQGMIGTEIIDLTSFNNKLYGYSMHELYRSHDDGDTWQIIHTEKDNLVHTLPINPVFTVTEDFLVGIVNDQDDYSIRLCQLSDMENKLIPIDDLPKMNVENVVSDAMLNDKTDINEISNSKVLLSDRVRLVQEMIGIPDADGLAYSRGTFFLAYNHKLYKLRKGNSKWIYTGLDIGKTDSYNGLHLVASDQLVYVGKEDGQLIQSLDAGENWKNITDDLPLTFKKFNAITFSGSTLYVSTDSGVLMLDSGKVWWILRDKEERIISMDTIIEDNSNIYGACQSGIYKIKNGLWERISPGIPYTVNDLEIHNGKFFVVTYQHGIFTMPVDI